VARTRSKAQDRGIRRPLLGFGWGGTIALMILVSLLVTVAIGVDLRDEIYRAVYEWLGLDAVFTLLLSRHLPQYLALGWPIVGPVCLIYILPALHIAPGRRPWWIWLGTTVSAGVLPFLWYSLVRGRFSGTFPPWLGGDWLGFAAVVDLGAAAGLGLVTRSLLVPAVTGIASVACCWIASSSWATPGIVLGSTWGWHAAIAGAMLTWAIRKRMQRTPAWSCKECGYDCRGVVASVCPECGTARS
jgi:hypothetical protein